MEQIFFFSFPFFLRIRYNIAVRVLYRQCFLIYRAKSGSHCLIVCVGVDWCWIDWWMPQKVLDIRQRYPRFEHGHSYAVPEDMTVESFRKRWINFVQFFCIGRKKRIHCSWSHSRMLTIMDRIKKIILIISAWMKFIKVYASRCGRTSTGRGLYRVLLPFPCSRICTLAPFRMISSSLILTSSSILPPVS